MTGLPVVAEIFSKIVVDKFANIVLKRLSDPNHYGCMNANEAEQRSINADNAEIEDNSGVALAWGLGLGVGVGAAVGLATGDLGWLAIGTAIGVGAQGLALLFRR